MKEIEIENLIYRMPWLINDQYIRANIEGSSKEYGKQVNIGINLNRYIDLLLKDEKTNRPVIVEIKKGNISRQDVAQILEYKALVNALSLDDEKKKEWEKEFELNYFSPKLVLLGKGVTMEIKLMAQLAGVDVLVFGDLETKKIDFSDTDLKIKEWNAFKALGGGLSERAEKISTIIEKIYDFLEKGLSIREVSLKYSYNEFPFVEFSIKKQKEVRIAFYEYVDVDGFRFNEKDLYIDIYNIEEEVFNTNKTEIKNTIKGTPFTFYDHYEPDNTLVFKMNKKKFFKETSGDGSFIEPLLEIYNTYFKPEE